MTFHSSRTIAGWKITGNGQKGAQGVVGSYMVKILDHLSNQWRNIAGANNVPRVGTIIVARHIVKLM